MKTFISILAFIVSWAFITFGSAICIALVFNLDYTSVVTFPVFVVVSLLFVTVAAGNIASEVYDKLEEEL